MSHSKYSPSKSYLWLNCGKAIELLEGVEEAPSPHAERGTRLHEVMERHVMKYGFNPDKVPTKKQVNDGDYNKIVKTYQIFSNWVNRHFEDYEIELELKVKMGAIRPGCFGTSDIIIKSSNSICIADWKFGRVKVSPMSSQLNLYMIGAVGRKKYKTYYNAILQPLSRHYIDTYKYGQEEFDGFKKEYKQVPKDFNIGPWCEHYARCRPRCPAYREKKIKEARKFFQ